MNTPVEDFHFISLKHVVKGIKILKRTNKRTLIIYTREWRSTRQHLFRSASIKNLNPRSAHLLSIPKATEERNKDVDLYGYNLAKYDSFKRRPPSL